MRRNYFPTADQCDLLSIVDAQAARIKELEEALRALCARYERDGDSALGESLCELLALVQGGGRVMGQSNSEYLKMHWSKAERDIRYVYPTHKWDAALLHSLVTSPMYGVATKSFIQELEARGYDIKTIRFSIRKARALSGSPKTQGEGEKTIIKEKT